MKRAICFILIISAAGCHGKKELSRFKIPADYKTWKKPVERVLDYEIPGHGNTFRVIYANATAFDHEIINAGGGRKKIVYKEGAVIIKEVYKKREDINRAEPDLTIMKKESGNEMALNGWVYCVKKPGKDPVIVTTRLCIGCHESANERHPYFDKNSKGEFRDYIFVPIQK